MLPATLLLGLLGGLAIGGGVAVTHYEKVMASNRADQAVVLADAAAEIDGGNPGKAREIARERLQLLTNSIATTFSGAGTHALFKKDFDVY